MACGKRRHIRGIAAADDAADGNAERAEMVDHHLVAGAQAVIGKRQPAEPVLGMDVDAGIVEDDVPAPALPDSSGRMAASLSR